jgi:hypothetical protein
MTRRLRRALPFRASARPLRRIEPPLRLLLPAQADPKPAKG